MAAKAVLLLCAQGIILKSISCQCAGSAYNAAANALAWDSAFASPYAAPAGAYLAAGGALSAPWAIDPFTASPYANSPWEFHSAASLAASNGRGLHVTSASPIAPTGITMTSENTYEGPLAVSGSLPFLGAIALEGALPSQGAGAVTYTSGNGNVGILSEDTAPDGYNTLAGAYGYGPGTAAELAAGYGYGSPLSYESGFYGPSNGYRGYGCGVV